MKTEQNDKIEVFSEKTGVSYEHWRDEISNAEKDATELFPCLELQHIEAEEDKIKLFLGKILIGHSLHRSTSDQDDKFNSVFMLVKITLIEGLVE